MQPWPFNQCSVPIPHSTYSYFSPRYNQPTIPIHIFPFQDTPSQLTLINTITHYHYHLPCTLQCFLLLRLRYSQCIHFSSYKATKQNSFTKPERGGDNTFWTWSNGLPIPSWNRRFLILIVKRELQRYFLLQTGNVNRVLNSVNCRIHRSNLFSDVNSNRIVRFVLVYWVNKIQFHSDLISKFDGFVSLWKRTNFILLSH